MKSLQIKSYYKTDSGHYAYVIDTCADDFLSQVFIFVDHNDFTQVSYEYVRTKDGGLWSRNNWQFDICIPKIYQQLTQKIASKDVPCAILNYVNEYEDKTQRKAQEDAEYQQYLLDTELRYGVE